MLAGIGFLCHPARAQHQAATVREPAVQSNTSLPRTKRIGVFVFNNFEPIDVWGFIQAFSIARLIGTGYDNAPPYPFEVVFISNKKIPAPQAPYPNQ